MSVTAVQNGDRLSFVATTAHTAGALAWYGGFYGHIQDDVAAGELATLILIGVWKFPRVPSTLSQGLTVSAPATEQATSLPILIHAAAAAASGVVPANATSGWNPIGKVWETGNATLAAIQLINR